MDKIYILKKNKLIRGPYTFEAIKFRGINQEDKLWFEGLTDWTASNDIEAFKPFIKTKFTGNLMKMNFLKRIFHFLR